MCSFLPALRHLECFHLLLLDDRRVVQVTATSVVGHIIAFYSFSLLVELILYFTLRSLTLLSNEQCFDELLINLAEIQCLR